MTTSGPHHAQEDELALDSALNAAQKTAVTAAPGPHLVVAGAGTGKTRTLVYRVAYMVAQGLAPESILLLTFTRRASQEMLRRASTVLDARCERVSGGTFHGFANLVLRRWAHLLGYTDGFTIVDRSDAGDLIGVVRTEGEYARKGRRFPRKDTLLDLLSKQVNTNRSLEQLLAEDMPQFVDDRDDIEDLGKRFAARKKELNVLDYDDLLVGLRDLLAGHEVVRAKLAATYYAVLVDEFQDTNRLQAHIAALLAAGHGNLMVVGDEAQSIYAFRGASFRNIVDFPRLFPNCARTVLEQNYRSTQAVLDLANAILAPAREVTPKTLFSELPTGPKPRYVRTDDDGAQAAFIAERILAMREEGTPLAEIAVLARAAWHTNALEVELQRRNIPFMKYGGVRFVEAAHIKDVCALLRLATNPRDMAAWHRVLTLLEGIGPTGAQRIASQVIEAGGDLEVLAAPHLARQRYGDDLAKLGALLSQLRGEDTSVSERLDEALAFYQRLMSKKYDDVRRRQQDLEALQTLAERYDTLDQFLADLAIDPPNLTRPQKDHDPDDEAITLSTVHSAKGLEWQAVFVINLNEGHFPNWASRDDPEAREEERRLLYVAVTRARRHLYLVRPDVLAQRGRGERIAEISPFLAELDLAALTEETVYTRRSETPAWGDTKCEAAEDDAMLRRIQAYFGDDA